MMSPRRAVVGLVIALSCLLLFLIIERFAEARLRDLPWAILLPRRFIPYVLGDVEVLQSEVVRRRGKIVGYLWRVNKSVQLVPMAAQIRLIGVLRRILFEWRR